MKASVVIPSYNACERLYYNLLSLNQQDIDKNEFEVIVIDNGSTDNTWEVISSIQLDINLKMIRCHQNQGRSKARNLGVQEANGEIIIFSDSDMISNRDFISCHIAEHKTDMTVICGTNWDKIYTYYYKDFKGKILKKFMEIQAKHNNKLDIRSLKDKQCLIDEESIIKGGYKDYSFKQAIQEHRYKMDIEMYGSDLSKYSFPWRFFITNNCSVRRENIIQAGLFDDCYEGWGCEDLDLGFRLYKIGCTFVKKEIQSIHQEHPTKSADEGLKNIYLFTEKYDSAEILLFYFSSYAAIDKSNINNVLSDIKIIEQKLSAIHLISIFKDMLKIVRDRELRLAAVKAALLDRTKATKEYILTNKNSITAGLTDIEKTCGSTGFAAAFRTLSFLLFRVHI